MDVGARWHHRHRTPRHGYEPIWLPLALPARSNGVPARLMLLPKRGVGCESRNGGKEKGK